MPLPPFLRDLARGVTNLLRAPPLIVDGEWLKSVLGSSSGDGSAPVGVPCGARAVIMGAPAPSPMPRGGVPLQGPPSALAVEDGVDDVLGRAQESSVVRKEFLRKVMDAMGQLGGELADVDACLEAEGLQLVEERCKLKVAVNLVRHQRELDNAKAEASLAVSRKACSRAIEEAREADQQQEVTEKRAWELQAWSASLEQQVELRQAALASLKGTPVEEEELRRREEVLTLEAAERNLDLERLETRERQVIQAEDDVGAREARIQQEVHRRMVQVRADLVREYDQRVELIEAEAAGRTAALRSKLTEAAQRTEATAAALVSAQTELASSRAEMLLLQRQVDDAESVARQNKEEILQRQTLEHMLGPMLQGLRDRANTALGNICDANAPHPHMINYAGHLQFFTNVVTHLENRSERARHLTKVRSCSLLGRASSHVFSHLQDRDPHFDFDAAIAPVPVAIRGDLARWVEDNVDALVRAFASDNDGVIVAADEGDMVNDGENGTVNGDGDFSDSYNGASGSSGSDQEDALSDMSK